MVSVLQGSKAVAIDALMTQPNTYWITGQMTRAEAGKLQGIFVMCLAGECPAAVARVAFVEAARKPVSMSIPRHGLPRSESWSAGTRASRDVDLKPVGM